MSSTASVSFGDRNIWAYDVALSILLAEVTYLMVSLADSLPQEPAHDHEQRRPPWLRSVANDLRVHATVGADLHLALDQLSTSPAPISSYRQQFTELLTDVLTQAAARLRGRNVITAADAATWQALPSRTVIWRGAAELPTQPIAELADAMIALIDGTLPQPPEHTWWLYGHPGGRQTVPMKPGSDEKG